MRRAQPAKKKPPPGSRERGSAPAETISRLRMICEKLPEAYEERAWVGTRWMVSKRNFAHVLEIDGGWPPAYARAASSAGPVTVLTFRTSEILSDALRTNGPPFFFAEWGTKWGTKVIGMTLGPSTDWDEVALLVTESYRLLAPKALLLGPRSNPR